MSCEAYTGAGNKCTRRAVTDNLCRQHSKLVSGPKLETITITFGDVAENHVGMQQLGRVLPNGFSVAELQSFKSRLEQQYDCEYVDLVAASGLAAEELAAAAVLIVRKFLDTNSADTLYKEQRSLPWDNKAKMYGKVLNKKARYNLCYDEVGQEPDYEQGKGRVIAFSAVTELDNVRQRLLQLTGGSTLVAEGNYYYDVEKCGIGFHGDSERKIVMALRLGESIPLHYQWYYKSQPVGSRIALSLSHGDLYIMSEKAVGFDWRKKNVYTLRHAAGAAKYLV